ncbi:GNAT family N-acetyltransferase, partial [Rickettsiales endosymbiont of Peranema trichophorum]|uniref:GNAT family N-acetyltransferase n=1 Tax=Rickettsiales endosymbiont of Peranema trichophorum TaxID=2486577 RepID=UPI00397AB2B6
CDDLRANGFLIKKFRPVVSLNPATLEHYPIIQNIARFYVYDLSKECGHISADWAVPADGLYFSFDLKHYFTEPSSKVYLVKVYDELGGFALLNKATENPDNTWNLAEFFIIAKFQGQGIAKHVAHRIWDMNPGRWEVAAIPEHKSAIAFWTNTIKQFTNGLFDVSTQQIAYDKHQPRRVIFTFDTALCKTV